MATCPRTHRHTNKPATAGVQLVGHTSINIFNTAFIRSVVRAKGTLANTIPQGKVEMKSSRGRPSRDWSNDVKEWTGQEWDVEGARGPCRLKKVC